MMSEFGGDPNAQLMDSTRGVIRSCTTTFAFLGPEFIELLLATHPSLVLYQSLVDRMLLACYGDNLPVICRQPFLNFIFCLHALKARDSTV